MSKLDVTDIQGFVLRGYALPFAQFLIAMPSDATAKSGSFVDLTGRYRSVDLLQQLPARRDVISRLRKALLAPRR